MTEWLKQQGQSTNDTQPMSAVGSRSTRVRSYKFHNLKQKPEFTFTMLLQPLCGYQLAVVTVGNKVNTELSLVN